MTTNIVILRDGFFLSHPHTNNEFFFLFTIESLFWNKLSEVSEYYEMQCYMMMSLWHHIDVTWQLRAWVPIQPMKSPRAWVQYGISDPAFNSQIFLSNVQERYFSLIGSEGDVSNNLHDDVTLTWHWCHLATMYTTSTTNEKSTPLGTIWVR